MLTVLCLAQGVPNPRPAPLNLTQPTIRDKNFYVLSRLERDPEAKKAIEADESLRQIATAKRERFVLATDTCGEDNACLHAAFRFNEGDIASAADALRQLYKGNSAIHRLTDGAVRDSGAYIRYNAEPGDLVQNNHFEPLIRTLKTHTISAALPSPRIAGLNSLIFLN